MEKTILLAGCVILNKEGKILLIHRQTNASIQWETPGGRVRKNERSRDAVIREVHEEIGVKVNIFRYLGHCIFYERKRGFRYSWFLGVIISGHPKLKETRIFNEMGYFSWSELSKINLTLSQGVQKLLNAYTNKRITI